MPPRDETSPCDFQPGPAGGFFCHCGQGSVGLPAPPTCWKCWLKTGPPTATPPRRESLDDVTSCVYRGEKTRVVNCTLCGGRDEAHQIYSCTCVGIPKPECTLSIRGRDDRHTVAVCLDCPERKATNGDDSD